MDLGTDVSFAVVERGSELVLLVDTGTFHRAFGENSTYPKWIKTRLATCQIAQDDGYLIRPQDGKCFLTFTACRTLVRQEAYLRSELILDWLVACESRLAPQLLGLTAKAIQGNAAVH